MERGVRHLRRRHRRRAGGGDDDKVTAAAGAPASFSTGRFGDQRGSSLVWRRNGPMARGAIPGGLAACAVPPATLNSMGRLP
jgi:hypothetical protein